MSHIMDRVQGRSRITIVSIFGLVLLSPAWTEAGKISSAGTADTLRAVATASSSPLSNSAIVNFLNAGTPVSESTTTTYGDGTAQTALLMIVPNMSDGIVTVTKDISLADGEMEKVIDVATVSGSTTTNMVTTTLPDGSIQTKGETDVTNGDTTTIKGTVSMRGGGTQTITGETVQRGSESLTVETITNSAGNVYHDRIAIVHNGQLSQTETNQTSGPGGAVSTVKSITSTVLNPSNLSLSAAQEGLTIPAPALAPQALDLEAQVLAPPGATTDVVPSPLPVPLPEPGTLTFLTMVLAAASLRRGWRSWSSDRVRRQGRGQARARRSAGCERRDARARTPRE